MKLFGVIFAVIFWFAIFALALKFFFNIDIFNIIKSAKDKKEKEEKSRIIENYKTGSSSSEIDITEIQTKKSSEDKFDKIKKLAELRNSGALTEEEFIEQKKITLAKDT